ncbi:MAG: hypothetical protein IJV27_04035 [Prevotella sp.]|nr:hypothetical protein [Prevotella sp.]
MKKLLYSLLAVLAIGCTFVSCGDDDDENYNYPTTAEIASAGTYAGTWTREKDGVIEEFDGTVTLEATDRVGVTNITFTCPNASLNATSVSNIWNANDGFKFQQNISTGNPDNGLGVAFAGNIYGNGTLTASFTLSQRSGRISVTYVYKFVGTKQ